MEAKDILAGKLARLNKRGRNAVFLISCLIAMAVIAMGLGASRRGTQQGVNRKILSVESGRPVAEAIKSLEDRYGWVITYEDPLYVNDAEIIDVTDSVSREPEKTRNGQGVRVLVPKGGTVAIEYDEPSDTKQPDNPSAIVQQLLDAHAAKGFAGRFRLELAGRAIHVIPTAYTNKLGQLVPQEPVLDAAITLPVAKRSGLQTLQAICDSVSQASGTSVVVATVPTNLFSQYQDQQGVGGQKARDVLQNLLESVGGERIKLSWRCLFDPDTKTYFLNIHPVRPINHPGPLIK
jgi:hypothetical protein